MSPNLKELLGKKLAKSSRKVRILEQAKKGKSTLKNYNRQ